MAAHSIPIDHFDFAYLKTCENVKEVAKIVQVLRSNQEGHFPDLTKFAEERLRQLAPESKLFRTESPIIQRDSHAIEISATIAEWTREIKAKDQNLTITDVGALEAFDSIKPPIRTAGQVKDERRVITKTKCATPGDYAKWDKYDPDTEILRLELEEERNREKSAKETPIIQEITETDVCRLTRPEKEELAQQHKYKGNDFFRAGDYPAALNEYSASLKLVETVLCLNNRALVHFKMGMHKKAIADCDRSLWLEPKNTKALFRKAESCLALDGQSSEAIEIYQQLLAVEPTNKVVLKRLEGLRKTRPEPKPHRMKITEVEPKKTPAQIVVEDLNHRPGFGFIDKFSKMMQPSGERGDDILLPYHCDKNDEDFLIRECK